MRFYDQNNSIRGKAIYFSSGFCSLFTTLCFQTSQWNDVITHPVKTGKYLQCPLCQERHEVPKEGVEGFRKNFYVSSLKSAGFGSNQKVGEKINQSFYAYFRKTVLFSV